MASLIRGSVRVSLAVAFATVLVGWGVLSTLRDGLRKIEETEKKFLARHFE